jgi:hypothetical protein
MNPLTKPLQSRINRLAHRQALQHEQRIKSELTARLQTARTDGASLEVLTRLLDDLEGVGPRQCLELTEPETTHPLT